MKFNKGIVIVLFEPRIPQNTGNIARTCAAFELPLILIEPLGFKLDDKHLKRAGLDYWPYIDITTFNHFDQFKSSLEKNTRILGFSKSGDNLLGDVEFKPGDHLLFGREDTGLPKEIREDCHSIVTIPMPGAANKDGTGGVRSLNLSSAVALASYQAASQVGIL